MLTAAHCIVEGGPNTVVLGELILENDADGAQPESIEVARIISHPQYDDRAIENDIAVLELVREVKTRDGVRPACLPAPDGLAGHRLPEKKAVEVAGWGAVNFRGPTAKHLQFGTINTVSQTECQQKLARFGNGEWRCCAVALQCCAVAASHQN